MDVCIYITTVVTQTLQPMLSPHVYMHARYINPGNYHRSLDVLRSPFASVTQTLVEQPVRAIVYVYGAETINTVRSDPTL